MAKNNRNLKIEKTIKTVRPLYKTLIIWIIIPLFAIMFLETIILFAAGMIPTFIAYIIDPSVKKQITKTVCYSNLAGCFIVAINMWTYNNTLDQALYLMSDAGNWLIMFGSASLGWLLYFIIRPMVVSYLAIKFEAKRKNMENIKKNLIEEWGNAVIPETFEPARKENMQISDNKN